MEDVAAQAVIAVLFTAVGAVGATVFHLHRQEQVERAEQERRVRAEFGQLLARWRPSIDAAQMRAVTAVVSRHRALFGDTVRALTARLSPTRVAVQPLALPTAGVPAVRHRTNTAWLDPNGFAWPLNTATAGVDPEPAEPTPVGRVHVDLDFNPADVDFETYVHGYGNYLRHQAALHVADPDATGVIPLRQIEGVSR